MAKKSWFSLLKKFFIGESQTKLDKEKRRRWAFGRSRVKRLTSVSAPSLPKEKPVTTEVEEEQSKHGGDAANATAAAATVVVWPTDAAKSAHQPEEETTKVSTFKVHIDGFQSAEQCERGIKDVAATRIQTAYRGYLARKALRALRGLVRLQAIIRGRAVRRQAVTTLKCLQSVVNIQSQICARRFQMAEGTCKNDDSKALQEFKDRVIQTDTSGEKRWDDRILSKDDANAIFLSKKEAAMKRERIKEYWLSHRRSAEPEHNKSNGKWRFWLEQWVDTQLSKNTDTVFPSNARMREKYQIDALGGSPIPVPKRPVHHKKQRSVGDDNGLSISPAIPTYMAATESAKAKARSMSSPRLRGLNPEIHSESNSPFKSKLSPSLKSLPAAVKSSRSLKDLSFDSESSLPYWGGNGAFR